MVCRAYEGDERSERLGLRATRSYDYATSRLCPPEKESSRWPRSRAPPRVQFRLIAHLISGALSFNERCQPCNDSDHHSTETDSFFILDFRRLTCL